MQTSGESPARCTRQPLESCRDSCTPGSITARWLLLWSSDANGSSPFGAATRPEMTSAREKETRDELE